MIKAVLFDFDDTLFKTIDIRVKAIKDAAYRFYKIRLSEKEIRKDWGKPIQEFTKILFGNIDSYENIMKHYLELVDKYPNEPHENGLKTINNLVKYYHTGIVSSSAKDLVIPELIRHKFPVEKFINVQTAEHTKVHKPNPEVFKPTLDKLKQKSVLVSEVLYVGDGIYDFLAARDAGMQFIGIYGRTTPKKHFKKQGARTISKLKELTQILKPYP